MNGIMKFILWGVLATVVACSPSTKPGAEQSAATRAMGSKYLLPSEPVSSLPVIAARQSAKQGDSVVVVGRIGGSVNPWIDGLAAFTIVDASLKACSDTPGDTCPKPWDYCCVTDQLPAATALIKLVDDRDAVVDVDARSLLNLKELDTVVVRGKAVRDDSGNLVVMASGLFVRE